ncbi:hypothetical protein Mkiyose1665_09380 [Mycobacterium kiyosense]|uniref:Uncharacterized protein n=1 Tax=Mycobacterium kiyosense TaxID=2871094 RepID=A0A9P3UYC7_9MYCO|nr:hypothetical protein IWGMT90018_19840 [Mycobacterium kiyosense]BDE15161.1 hypothetical protein MKCMC460_40210 [Mycobacterium sp. 20KCMC460]GLB81644.1 hypothetical protein SRL2020028_09000 [Mycobacterium kiyosense]GLB87577.1 hypothetical protein SRL2020130_03940 [Mycobacterium kiyosense]GLB94224.1 hypothetical protein SRL2020226_10000 [Mycobacterium kiyosense]
MATVYCAAHLRQRHGINGGVGMKRKRRQDGQEDPERQQPEPTCWGMADIPDELLEALTDEDSSSEEGTR